MGFLALYKLVGTDGGFMMHTRSRETGEDIKGFWKPGGFEEYDDVSDILEGEYGTAIKIETEYDELNKAVEKHSEWSRVPIRVDYYEDLIMSIIKQTFVLITMLSMICILAIIFLIFTFTEMVIMLIILFFYITVQ